MKGANEMYFLNFNHLETGSNMTVTFVNKTQQELLEGISDFQNNTQKSQYLQSVMCQMLPIYNSIALRRNLYFVSRDITLINNFMRLVSEILNLTNQTITDFDLYAEFDEGYDLPEGELWDIMRKENLRRVWHQQLSEKISDFYGFEFKYNSPLMDSRKYNLKTGSPNWWGDTLTTSFTRQVFWRIIREYETLEVQEAMFEQYCNMIAHLSPNGKLLLQRRQKLASKLGFPSFTDLVLSKSYNLTFDEAKEFINTKIKKFHPIWEKYLELMIKSKLVPNQSKVGYHALYRMMYTNKRNHACGDSCLFNLKFTLYELLLVLKETFELDIKEFHNRGDDRYWSLTFEFHDKWLNETLGSVILNSGRGDVDIWTVQPSCRRLNGDTQLPVILVTSNLFRWEREGVTYEEVAQIIEKIMLAIYRLYSSRVMDNLMTSPRQQHLDTALHMTRKWLWAHQVVQRFSNSYNKLDELSTEVRFSSGFLLLSHSSNERGTTLSDESVQQLINEHYEYSFDNLNNTLMAMVELQLHKKDDNRLLQSLFSDYAKVQLTGDEQKVIKLYALAGNGRYFHNVWHQELGESLFKEMFETHGVLSTTPWRVLKTMLRNVPSNEDHDLAK